MWIKSSLLALGFAGAMVASTPAPAPAQGVYVGPHGVGVDLGRPRYREHYRGITIMPMTAAVGAAGQSPSSEPEACARSDAAINRRRVRPAREPQVGQGFLLEVDDESACKRNPAGYWTRLFGCIHWLVCSPSD